MSATPGPASMRAVERVCDLLDALRERPAGISLDGAAHVSGLPRSSAYRYLLALERRGYVARDRARGTFCAARRRTVVRGRAPGEGTADRLAEVLRPLRRPAAV
ncbi:MAG: helix-turn-helix domain-containing protein, partial [Microbacterium sp.]|nr:helix-turn-helix domain-containing protein [Microbacterium sp.]